MAWRITRGLFRLWLVSSVLWAGSMAAVTWQDLAYPILSDAEVGLSPAIGGELPDAPWILREKREMETIKYAVGLALVPPMLVLMIGSALVWAFRGFRT
jgi:hypothetical protein